MSAKKTKAGEKSGLFLYVTPVSGVYLGKNTKGEHRIDKVTLFSRDRFLRTRRFSFVYTQWRKKAAECAALNTSSVVAAVTAGGDPATARRFAHNLIKEELSILSSSRLGCTGRDRRGVVGISGCMDSYETEDMLLGLTVDLMQTSSQRHAPDGVRITDAFLKLPDKFFPYRRLLWLIRGHANIDSKWRRILRNATILIGRSQNAIEVADAFLWDMIALEQLLLGEKETSGHRAKLLMRCQSLFGYCPLWDQRGLTRTISHVYDARCKLVHEGDRDQITLGHLIATDLILSNVVGSLVFNSGVVRCKGDLLEHADKAKARNQLGLDPRGSKWHWYFSNLDYSAKRLKEFWAL